MSDLARRSCTPCEGGVAPMTDAEMARYLEQVGAWNLVGGALERVFAFKNYYETMAFVNAVAWIAHREDHHPDIAAGYKSCMVRYVTHAIGGLSENDFICAAKIDALVDG